MSACDGLSALTKRFPRLTIRCSELGYPPAAIMLKVEDSLDNQSSVAFIKAIEDLLSTNRSLQKLSLDLSGLRYVSSTGIGALASTMMCAQKYHVDYQILDPSPHVDNLLNMLGFSKFLPIVRTAAGA